MAILVLGGGWQQLPAILKAREMGLRVMLPIIWRVRREGGRSVFIWSAPEIGKRFLLLPEARLWMACWLLLRIRQN